MKTNKDRIMGFRNLIKENLLLLIDGDYALLDVPNHGNIGDNLIWEGEVQFLKNNVSHKCLYSANVLNWNENKIKDADVILFHGGGNWGDLYRMCQDHRLYVISKYINKRIIVFPQTAWYKNVELLVPDCDIINKHPNIVVCLRDQNSYDLLSRYIDKSKLRLLPDMAYFVDIEYNDEKAIKTLVLKRTDSEQKDTITIPENACVSDWPVYPNNKMVYHWWHRFFVYKNELSVLLQRSKLTSWMVSPEYGINRHGGRERYVKKGIIFFSKYNKIYTTRLHGLILGTLMGKDMYVVDNKYNKCLNFYNTWLRDFDNIHII